MVDLEQDAWRPIQNPAYPWGPTLERFVLSCIPPSMAGPVVYIASDYSGEHKESEFETISILYLDQHQSRSWDARRRVIRRSR